MPLAVSDWAGGANPAQRTGECQTGETEGHSGRSCCAGLCTVTRGQLTAKALIRCGDTILGTHTPPLIEIIPRAGVRYMITRDTNEE